VFGRVLWRREVYVGERDKRWGVECKLTDATYDLGYGVYFLQGTARQLSTCCVYVAVSGVLNSRFSEATPMLLIMGSSVVVALFESLQACLQVYSRLERTLRRSSRRACVRVHTYTRTWIVVIPGP